MYRLTCSQERIYINSKIYHNKVDFNNAIVLKLSGNVNLAYLKQAINLYINNYHSNLKYKVVNQEYVYYQTTSENTELSCLEYGASNKKLDIEIEVKKFIKHIGSYDFDLDNGPLYIIGILETSINECYLAINAHELACDSLSIELMLKSLIAIYNHFRIGTVLPPQPIKSFADYLIEYNELAHKKDYTQYLSYWRERVQNHKINLKFNNNITQPSKEYAAASYDFELGTLLSKELKILARRYHVQLASVIKAIFAITIQKYCHIDKFCILDQVSTRTPMYSTTSGSFSDYVPLAFNFDSSTNVADFITRLNNQIVSSKSYSEVGIVRILNNLYVRGVLQPGEMFNVSVSGIDKINIKETMYEVSMERAKLATHNILNDLHLSYSDDKYLKLVLAYKKSAFDKEFIVQFVRHFIMISRSVSQDTMQKIRDIEYISAKEVLQLVSNWGHSYRKYNSIRIDVLFDSVAKKNEFKVAISTFKRRYSYESLLAKTNQLANHILKRANNIGEFNVSSGYVGIVLDKSVDLPVAMLAVLKLGAVAVPIAPSVGAVSLNDLTGKFSFKAIITNKKYEKIAVMLNKHCVIRVDTDAKDILMESEFISNSNRLPNKSAIAIPDETTKEYLILDHKNIVSMVYALKHKLQADKIDLLSTMSIETSSYLAEVFLPLFTGGTHYFFGSKMPQKPETVIEYINKYNISYLSAAMLSLSLLVKHADKSNLKNCTILTYHDGMVDKVLIDKISYLTKNIYTIFGIPITTGLIAISKVTKTNPYSLGKPAMNNFCCILDKHHNLVPIGVAGELYVGGEQLARHSTQDDGKVYEFINSSTILFPDDSLNLPDKLHKTGKLARWNADGILEYISEHETTNNNHIEELEEVLISHPNISSCYIATFNDNPQNLVVYYVLKDTSLLQKAISNTPCDTKIELMNYLQNRIKNLNSYITFIKLKYFPLTRHGTLDRQKLSYASKVVDNDVFTHLYPLDSYEYCLVQIWEQVLKRTVSVNAPFYVQGGIKQDIIKLIDMIFHVFKVKLNYDFVLQYPTIKLQANHLRTIKNYVSTCEPFYKFNKIGDKPALIFFQHEILEPMCYQELIVNLNKHFTCYVISKPNALEQTNDFKELIDYYKDKVYDLCHNRSVYLAGWSVGGNIALKIGQELINENHKVNNIFLFDSFVFDNYRVDFAKTIESLPYRFKDLLHSYPTDKIEHLQSEVEYYNNIFQVNKLSKIYGKALLFKASQSSAEVTLDNFKNKYNGFKKHIRDLEVKTIKASHSQIIFGNNAIYIANYIISKMEAIQAIEPDFGNTSFMG